MAAAWSAIGLVAAFAIGSLFYLGSRIDGIGNRLDSLSARMDSRFDRMDARFDGLQARIDSHFDRHAN